MLLDCYRRIFSKLTKWRLIRNIAVNKKNDKAFIKRMLKHLFHCFNNIIYKIRIAIYMKYLKEIIFKHTEIFNYFLLMKKMISEFLTRFSIILWHFHLGESNLIPLFRLIDCIIRRIGFLLVKKSNFRRNKILHALGS